MAGIGIVAGVPNMAYAGARGPGVATSLCWCRGRAAATAEERAQNGVPLPARIWAEITAAAARYGIATDPIRSA